MRLSRIFVDHPLQQGALVQLDVDRSHYVRNVLRLKPGTSVLLFNGRDLFDYEALLSYEGKQAIASIQKRVASNGNPGLSTEIIQGLSRSDHMDWMIQKCTELGVTRISVFNAKHTQIPLKSNQLAKRLMHWRNIALKACEQSGRQVPPQLDFYQTIAEAIEIELPRELKFLLSFEGTRLQSNPATTNTNGIALLLGPEGGLSETEIKSALDAGFIATRLGPRVLRTETAAASALAIVQYIYGDM